MHDNVKLNPEIQIIIKHKLGCEGETSQPNKDNNSSTENTGNEDTSNNSSNNIDDINKLIDKKIAEYTFGADFYKPEYVYNNPIGQAILKNYKVLSAEDKYEFDEMLIKNKIEGNFAMPYIMMRDYMRDGDYTEKTPTFYTIDGAPPKSIYSDTYNFNDYHHHTMEIPALVIPFTKESDVNIKEGKTYLFIHDPTITISINKKEETNSDVEEPYGGGLPGKEKRVEEPLYDAWDYIKNPPYHEDIPNPQPQYQGKPAMFGWDGDSRDIVLKSRKGDNYFYNIYYPYQCNTNIINGYNQYYKESIFNVINNMIDVINGSTLEDVYGTIVYSNKDPECDLFINDKINKLNKDYDNIVYYSIDKYKRAIIQEEKNNATHFVALNEEYMDSSKNINEVYVDDFKSFVAGIFNTYNEVCEMSYDYRKDHKQ